jgi:hypothetical protein
MICDKCNLEKLPPGYSYSLKKSCKCHIKKEPSVDIIKKGLKSFMENLLLTDYALGS